MTDRLSAAILPKLIVVSALILSDEAIIFKSPATSIFPVASIIAFVIAFDSVLLTTTPNVAPPTCKESREVEILLVLEDFISIFAASISTSPLIEDLT